MRSSRTPAHGRLTVSTEQQASLTEHSPATGWRQVNTAGANKTPPDQISVAATSGGATAARIARFAAEVAAAKHGEGIVILDVEALTPLATYFVLVSARNPRLGATIVDDLARSLRRHLGIHPRLEGRPGESWVILDCVDVVIHVLSPEARAFYQLERLWSDALVETFETGA
jgi:ribosome-associated protein